MYYVHTNDSSGYALVMTDTYEGRGPDGTRDHVHGPFKTKEEADRYSQQWLKGWREKHG